MIFKTGKVNFKPIKLLDTTKSYYIIDVEIAIVHKTSALFVDSYNCLLFIQCTAIFKMAYGVTTGLVKRTLQCPSKVCLYVYDVDILKNVYY